MVIWSSLKRPTEYLFRYCGKFQKPLVHYDAGCFRLGVPKRNMSGHHEMSIKPSSFQWNKFKDMLHYYVMLGVIPITALLVYTNIFIGPAQLEEIPEGYVPKHWEYERHPITRFLARYVHTSPQQEYEKYMHHLYEETEKQKLRMVEGRVRELMSERNDYKAYYYRPIIGKYHRVYKEAADTLQEIRGDT